MSGPATTGPLTVAAVLGYVLLLLAVARHADRVRFHPGQNVARGVSYALSLSVLCTSWTYFGAVGSAIRNGWGFLPNSLGPIVALTLLWPVWQRIAIVSRRENVSSVADFIASRYGKSRPLGALIACVAIVGALPYIALQIMTLLQASATIFGRPEAPPVASLLLVAVLAALSVLFGARRPTLTQHNRGLTGVVTLEAVVKLAALIAVAVLAVVLLRGDGPRPRWGALGSPPVIDGGFVTSTLLCTVTMFTLPRVFHLGFVTLEEIGDLKVGRWLFPSYMAVWAAAIVPIAIAGATRGTGDPDLVVLDLPLRFGNAAVATLAFLGGISAGAAMVMVETIALSAMISNELILPWLARNRWTAGHGTEVGTLIVRVRQVAIVAILALSYLSFLHMPPTVDLQRLGFASLAASAQLAPALLGAVLWRRGHAQGAFWGIAAGMLIWLLTVGAPQLGLAEARFGGGTGTASGFNEGVWLSLAANLAIYVGVSLVSRERLIDRIQANAFLAGGFAALKGDDRNLNGTVGDLRRLLARFVGPADAALGLADFGRGSGHLPLDDEAVTPAVARMAERMLAGAIGASSARNVIALALADDPRDASAVNQILDQAAHAVHFSREILSIAVNAIDQGISVVDADLRLVAWNERYVELFRYPGSEVYVGKPLADLIALNARRAGLSPQEQSSAVEERLGPMQRRERQLFEREWSDGLIVRVVGRPLGTGEYVTSFTDVTEVRTASRLLARSNEELDHRVRTRTHQLMVANEALTEAKAVAERVVNAQNRFVAAASHDLLQPLHAARLYLGAAREDLPGLAHAQGLLTRADLSIEAANRLLHALLNLSRIEVGGIVPEFQPVDLDELLSALEHEFAPLAEANGLMLRMVRTDAWALSNPDLLRSVLQNLLSNAIRYASRGRVLVGVRPDGDRLRIEVRDNGPGIAAEARELIFREFTRLPETSGQATGTGLGLAIAQRICAALDHRLTVRSAKGRGSVFSVAAARAERRLSPTPAGSGPAPLGALRVLCVEDKAEILHAQRLLLEGWGAVVCPATTIAEALSRAAGCDVAIADLHLGAGLDGLDLLAALPASVTTRLLLSADTSEAVRQRAAALGVAMLGKPVKPASLRAFLTHAAQVRVRPAAAAAVREPARFPA